MSASRKSTFEELHDPWVLHYEFDTPRGGPVPFPSARNHKEVERAARAIIAGRSPGVQGWLNKRVAQLAALGVDREVAEHDIAGLKAAIEARIVRLFLTEGDDEN